MTEHTPGPWRIDYFERYIFANDVDDNEFVVADIGRNILVGDWRSNACLIAAAPTMYEKLEVSYQTVRNIALNLPKGSDLRIIAENEAHSIFCVLKEAKGEQA